MNNEQKQKLIEKFLVLLTKKVEKSDIYTHPSFKTLIVAGSYADWKKNINGISAPSWRSLPDINIYLIINGTNKEHLMISNFLARIYNELTNELDFNLLLDLHPFYKSYGNIDEKRFNLQLTTRVINSKNLNMYPDYCWFGWQSNFYELCSKEQNYLNKLYIRHPKRDLNWLKYMYLALASYNNAVHMAVLSSMFEKDEVIFDEIYRYIKEVSKDGMSLAITIDENFDYLDIKKWKSSLPEFYEKYYGKEARTIIEKLEYYEHDYFKARKSISINQIAGEFAVLLDAVYEKGFIERKKQLVRILKNDELILPMWY